MFWAPSSWGTISPPPPPHPQETRFMTTSTPAPAPARPGPAVTLPARWCRRLESDPTRWAGAALETFGANTVVYTNAATGSRAALTYSPLARDLIQSDLLDSFVPWWASELHGPGSLTSQSGSAHASSKQLAKIALDAVLQPAGAAVMKQEIARACTLISCTGMSKTDDSELDLLRIMRRVFYSTMLRVLAPGTGPDDDSKVLGLLDAIASDPINPITLRPISAPTARGFGHRTPVCLEAARELNRHWGPALLDSNGIVPKIFRDADKYPLGIEMGFRDLYFKSFLTSLMIAAEPAALSAATTLDFCLRAGIKDVRGEFAGVIRRSPPVPFISREIPSMGPGEREVALAPNLKLHRGDRIILHVPSMFDHDPHSPYQDAFGVGAHRCIGSSIAVAFMRASLEPIYLALCGMMASPASRAGHVKLDLDAVRRLRAASKRPAAVSWT